MESKLYRGRIGSHILATKPPTFQLLSEMKKKRLVIDGNGCENQKKKCNRKIDEK